MSPAGIRTRPGRPYPLGATWDGAGVNFALFSEHATSVELCLFDPGNPARETHRIPIRERTDQIWHVYLPEARPELLYGYRVDGPWQPRAGHRFNPAKVLIDPYAKAIAGAVSWNDAMFGHKVGVPDGEMVRDERDNAAYLPKSAVIDPAFTWGDDRLPRTPWHRTVIYEVHVKGFTARQPDVPRDKRGSYSGLSSPASIEHLKRLGITAVELLPVQHSVSEKDLRERGLTNYWGYNSIGFFAPDARFASVGARGAQVAEFKTMVKTLHQAGIEVILDVVYNHTAEGNHLGPTLSFRGIDNAAYYRLDPEDRRRYIDYTGCGNTLNMMHPRTIQLIMDSLRYWVLEMHVDGFRFDLAATLARELHDVDRLSAFFDVIHQDPVISQVKLIAEPWDLGEGGYQVGNFPVGWAEWNGKYRDTVRRYWRGRRGPALRAGLSPDGLERSLRGGRAAALRERELRDCPRRLHARGSRELRREAQRGQRRGQPRRLRRQPLLERRHRGPDGRQRRSSSSASDRCATSSPRCFLSQGIPMLCGGDEIARTQGGNNNAYCQDNDISWYQWALSRPAARFFEFTERLIRLRLEHPVFHRRTFFHGRRVLGAASKDLSWFRPDGKEVTEEDWGNGQIRCLGLRLAGDAIEEVNDMGEPIVGDTFLVLLNAHDQGIPFILPAHEARVRWEPVLDTRAWDVEDRGRAFRPGDVYDLDGRSLAVLRLRPRPRAQ